MRFNPRKFQSPVVAIDPLEAVKRRAQDLAGEGRVDEAVELLSDHLQKNPRRTDLLLGLGRILLKAERYLEAIDVLLVLQAHLPASGDVQKMLATVYGQTRQYTKSKAYGEAAAKLTPEDAEVWMTLARALENLGEQRPAIEAIEQAIRIKPNDPDLRCTAASLLHHAGRDEEASRILLESPEIAARPDVRLLEAMLFPVVPASVEEILGKREHLRKTLEALSESGVEIADPDQALRQSCFLLGYHGLHDRELIEHWATTLIKLCPALSYLSPALKGPPRKRPPLASSPLYGRRIKIGVVSSNMRNHSVGRVLNRIVQGLDRARFETILFELPGKFEGGQELGRDSAERTVPVPRALDRARQTIEAEQPDVLIFPDFVLDPFNDQLAFSRLAPVQCSTWGHPGTSGRPSLDYWISCEDWEPAGNEALYTEKLVRFKAPPMIATALKPPDSIASREELGLPSTGRLYGCPQSIYKLHPDFDRALATILERDPDGYAVVIGGVQPFWLDQYFRRFRSRFGDLASRLVMLGHLSTRDYLSLLTHCEVSLDPFHFGGANTSMEAFVMGLPVVTWPGDQLRNRQTYSFYRMMEFMELVVDSEEAYVDLALRIGQDRTFRGRLSHEVRSRCPVIFDTESVVEEFEQFFENAVSDVRAGCIARVRS